MAFLNYDGLKRYDKKTKEYIEDKIKNIKDIDVDKLATKDDLDTNRLSTSNEYSEEVLIPALRLLKENDTAYITDEQIDALFE